MDGAIDSSSINSRGTKTLKILVITLLVLLILVASVAAFLYIQLRQSNNNSYAQPKYVQLLKSQQVSTAVGVSNCTTITAQGVEPSLAFYNASNPTGLEESEVMTCPSTPTIVVFVAINGFNRSSYADFAYQNYQLGSSLYNFTTSGSIAPSESYSIFGTCDSSSHCLVLEGLAISSLYVVRINLNVGVVGPTPSLVNASMLKAMLGMQLSTIQNQL